MSCGLFCLLELLPPYSRCEAPRELAGACCAHTGLGIMHGIPGGRIAVGSLGQYGGGSLRSARHGGHLPRARELSAERSCQAGHGEELSDDSPPCSLFMAETVHLEVPSDAVGGFAKPKCMRSFQDGFGDSAMAACHWPQVVDTNSIKCCFTLADANKSKSLYRAAWSTRSSSCNRCAVVRSANGAI